MFVFLQNSSLLFSITRSFSVIHVSVNIKNNAAKDTTLFLSKSPGGHATSFQIKPSVAYGLPVDCIILHWYTCGAEGQSMYGHVITHGAPLRASRARALIRGTTVWRPL